MTNYPSQTPRSPSRTALSRQLGRWLAWGVAAHLALGGCAARSDFSASPVGAPDGVQLMTTISASDDAVSIAYSVENRSDQAVILADGVPAKDTTNLPAPAENMSYVTTSGDTTVFSRKAFDGLPVDDKSAPSLLLGRLLLPGETHQDQIELTDPWRSYAPGRPAETIDADGRALVKFCVGVVSPDALDADLQANTTEDRPVIHHGITQVTLCSDAVAGQ